MGSWQVLLVKEIKHLFRDTKTIVQTVVVPTFITPLLVGAIGLKSGQVEGGRAKALFSIGLYLKYTKVEGLTLYDVNNKFFTAENRQKDILYRSLLGVSVNIILNIILIEKFGINGAALATIAAQISTSLVYTYLKKDSRILFFMFLKCFDARRIFHSRN